MMNHKITEITDIENSDSETDNKYISTINNSFIEDINSLDVDFDNIINSR